MGSAACAQVKTYSDEVYFEDLKNLRPTRVLRTLDEAEIEALRLKNGILIGGELDTVVEDLDPGKKAKRGPLDSGKGVRIQGGKVYDSAHGVTCHW